MQHVSTSTMVERLTGLLDTNDLSAWEHGFVLKLQRLAAERQLVTLSEAQVIALDNLHAKHFA